MRGSLAKAVRTAFRRALASEAPYFTFVAKGTPFAGNDLYCWRPDCSIAYCLCLQINRKYDCFQVECAITPKGVWPAFASGEVGEFNAEGESRFRVTRLWDETGKPKPWWL